MKICLINSLYPPLAKGGAEKIVEIIAAGLKDIGHEVFIITGTPEKKSSSENINGLKIYRLPSKLYSPKKTFLKPFWHLTDLRACRTKKPAVKIIKQQKPEIILTHNLKGLGLGLLKTLAKTNIPIVHTLHDYQLLDPHGSMHRKSQNLALPGPFYRLYRLLTKRLILELNLVISPSEFVLKKHLEYGFFKQQKTLVLPNPVVIKNREIKNEPAEKLRLLYLGQLEPHKGVKLLIKAVSGLYQLPLKLTIAGDGSQFNELQQLADSDSRITLAGKVQPNDLAKLFENHDLLVVPSLWWENSPTVISESYQFKTPVLVSDSGGAKEKVKTDQTGWVFKSGDVNDLTKKIQLVFKEKNNLPEMGNAGFEFVKQFSLENYLKNLLAKCLNLNK